jgi:hypothetical protein
VGFNEQFAGRFSVRAGSPANSPGSSHRCSQIPLTSQ